MKRGAPVKRTREQRMRELLADARAYLYADDVAAGDEARTNPMLRERHKLLIRIDRMLAGAKLVSSRFRRRKLG